MVKAIVRNYYNFLNLFLWTTLGIFTAMIAGVVTFGCWRTRFLFLDSRMERIFSSKCQVQTLHNYVSTREVFLKYFTNKTLLPHSIFKYYQIFRLLILKFQMIFVPYYIPFLFLSQKRKLNLNSFSPYCGIARI